MKMSDTALPLYLMLDWIGSFAAAVVVALSAAAWLADVAVAFFFFTDVTAVTGLAGAAGDRNLWGGSRALDGLPGGLSISFVEEARDRSVSS